jgi:hypothetical protein
MKNYDELLNRLYYHGNNVSNGDIYLEAATAIQELQAECDLAKSDAMRNAKLAVSFKVERDELQHELSVLKEKHCYTKLAALTVEDELPPLPEPVRTLNLAEYVMGLHVFSTEQFIQGQRDAQAMLRAQLAGQDVNAELFGLLEEVSRNYTRDDALPDNLLPRIDTALTNAKAAPQGEQQ